MKRIDAVKRKCLFAFSFLFVAFASFSNFNHNSEMTLKNRSVETGPSSSAMFDEGNDNCFKTALNRGTYFDDHSTDLDAYVETTNFKIYYKSSSISSTSAAAAGSWYEDLRTSFLSMSFNTPINETGQSKFRIALDHTGSGSAATHRYGAVGNVSQCYIVHYNFSSVNTTFKETAAHEYFHAIQNAYNYNLAWFAEATANWAKIIINGTSYTCNGSINSFIHDGLSLDYDANPYYYGAAIFPLTLHKIAGSYTIIRNILEIYHNYGTTYSTSVLKTVINTAFQTMGLSKTFDSALRTMHSYMVNTEHWLGDFSVNSNWTNAQYINGNLYASCSTRTVTGTISPLSYKIYKINKPSASLGSIGVNVTFSGGDGWLQRYILNANGQESIVYDSHNSANVTVHNIGTTVDSCYFILSNTNLSENAEYTLKYTFYAREESLSFGQDTSLIEKRFYLSSGQESNIDVTFATAGKKIIQTLSSSDTVIKVYNSNDVLVNDYIATDDSGYNNNSFVTVNTSANELYYIRVSFYNSASSGYVRLLINNADRLINPNSNSIEEFADYWSITNQDSCVLYTFAERYKSQMLTYVPLTTGIHTIQLQSTFDNYLYIYDPSSTDLGVNGIDYDDNSGGGSNALISRNMVAGKTYLIVFCARYPSAVFPNQSNQCDITLTISI